MQIQISELKSDQIILPGISSYVFAIRFGEQYQLITTKEVDQLCEQISMIPNAKCSLNAEMELSQIINEDMSLDLIGILNQQVKQQQEIIAIPIVSHKIVFLPILQTVLREKKAQQIAVQFQLEEDYLQKMYPSFGFEKSQAIKFFVNLTMEILNPVIIDSIAQLDIECMSIEEMQVEDRTWQFTITIGDQKYRIQNGIVVQKQSDITQSVNQKAHIVNIISSPINQQHKYAIQLPTQSMQPLSLKQFQLFISNCIIKFQQVFQFESDKKKKNNNIRFIQEAFEAFVAKYHNLSFQSPINIISNTDVKKLNVICEIKPILLNMSKQQAKVEKTTGPYQTCFGIGRHNFVDAKELDDPLYSLQGQLAFSENSLQNKHACCENDLIPFDPFFTSKQEQVSQKDKKKPQPNDYSDGSPNRIYSNVICGIQKIVEKFDRIPVRPQQPNFSSKSIPISKLLTEYQEKKTDFETVKNIYEKLLKYSSFVNAFEYNQEQLLLPKLKASIFMEQPVCVKKILYDDGFKEAEQRFNKLLNYKQTAPFQQQQKQQAGSSKKEQLENITMSLYSNIANQLVSEPQAAVPFRPITRQDNSEKIMQQKQSIQKSHLLRGVSGNIRARQNVIIPKINQFKTLDCKRILEQISAEGFVEQLSFGIQENLQLMNKGFTTYSELVGYVMTTLKELNSQLVLQVNSQKKQRSLSRKQSFAKIMQKRSTSNSGFKESLGQLHQKTPLSLKNKSFVLEKQISDEEKKIQDILKQNCKHIYLLTASNVDRYANVALQLIFGVLQRVNEEQNILHRCSEQNLNLANLLQTCKDAKITRDIGGILTCAVVCGLKLAQPLEMSNYLKCEKINKFLQKPLSMIQEMLRYEGWKHVFIPQLAILVLCIMATEEKTLVLQDMSQEPQLKQIIHIDSQFEKLLEPIIQCPYVGLHFLWNTLLCSNNEQQESKQLVTERLKLNDYRQNDVKLIFELIELEHPKPFQHSNIFIEKEEKIDIDETGKKVKLPLDAQIQTAQEMSLDIALKQADLHIITAFVYLLYNLKIISANTISDTLVQYQMLLYTQVEQKFRKNLQNTLSKILVDGNDFDSADDDDQIESPQSQNQTKQQLLGAFVKFLQDKRIQPTMHLNTAHLNAIQEYLIKDSPHLDQVVFQRQKYKSDEEYMLSFLDSGFSGKSSNITRASQLMCLSEWLLKRNEKFMSKIAINVALSFVKDEQNEKITQILMRKQLYLWRVMLLENQPEKIIISMDNVKQDSSDISIITRIKNTPAYGYIRAKSLNATKSNQADAKQQLSQEIMKFSLQSLIQLQKVKDFDEVIRGSTALQEVGFFDLEYGHSVMEMCLFNSSILQGDIDNEKLDNIESSLTSQDMMSRVNTFYQQPNENIQSNTNFLKIDVGQDTNNDVIKIQSDQNSPALQFNKKEQIEEKSKNTLLFDFQLKKQEIKLQQQIQKHSPTFESKTKNVEQQNQIKEQHESSQYKDKIKQILTISGAAKLLLEQFPSFGPAWAQYSFVQLAMNNTNEARMSSSISTLMSSFLPDCWVAWYVTEIGEQKDLKRSQWIKQEFFQQIDAQLSKTDPFYQIWEQMKKKM